MDRAGTSHRAGGLCARHVGADGSATPTSTAARAGGKAITPLLIYSNLPVSETLTTTVTSTVILSVLTYRLTTSPLAGAFARRTGAVQTEITLATLGKRSKSPLSNQVG